MARTYAASTGRRRTAGGGLTFSYWDGLSSPLRGCASDQIETAWFSLDVSTTTAPVPSIVRSICLKGSASNHD
jgi:hypothetical protein